MPPARVRRLPRDTPPRHHRRLARVRRALGRADGRGVALDATIEVRSARGERTIAARDFFLGPHETALEADELIIAMRVPAPPPGRAHGFHEVSARYRDYAQVAAAAPVTLDDGGDVHGSRARPPARRPSAAPRRRLATSSGRRSTTRATPRSRTSLPELEPAGRRRGLSGTYRRRVAVTSRAARSERRRRAERGSDGMSRQRRGARRGQRRLARGRRRAAPHARRLPARGSRPDRHARRLRARLLRQLQRPARRRDRPLVPDVRRAGRRPLGRRRSRVSPSPTARSARSSRRSTSTTACSAASARPRC